MWEFNEKAMCRLLKLVAHNHKKDDQFISMIEDALCLRVATSLKEKLPVKHNPQNNWSGEFLRGMLNDASSSEKNIDLVFVLHVQHSV